MSDFDGTIFTIENDECFNIFMEDVLKNNKDKILEFMNINEPVDIYDMISANHPDEFPPYENLDDIPEKEIKRAMYKNLENLINNSPEKFREDLIQPGEQRLILIMRNTAGYYERMMSLKLKFEGVGTLIRIHKVVDENNNTSLYFPIPS